MEEDFYTNWFGHRQSKEVKVRTQPLTPLGAFIMKAPSLVDLREIIMEYDDGVTEWVDVIDMAMNRLRINDVESYIRAQIIIAEEANRLLAKKVKKSVRLPSVDEFGGMTVKDPRNIWWVTFTSDPKKSDEQNKKDIDRYRHSMFKRFKYCWVEEKKSADSDKYHQHVLVQCAQENVHTGQGLKRDHKTHYYSAEVVKVLRQPYTKIGIKNRIEVYMSKENKPQGDCKYFLDLAETLGK